MFLEYKLKTVTDKKLWISFQKMQGYFYYSITISKVLIYKQKGDYMAKNEKSSKRVAKIASEVLRSKTSSKKAKTLAGSVLTQTSDKKTKKK